MRQNSLKAFCILLTLAFKSNFSVNMDNGTGQWRSWEHDGQFQKDFHHGGGGFPPQMGPGKMHGNFYNGGPNNFIMQQEFNNRMVGFYGLEVLRGDIL